MTTVLCVCLHSDDHCLWKKERPLESTEYSLHEMIALSRRLSGNLPLSVWWLIILGSKTTITSLKKRILVVKAGSFRKQCVTLEVGNHFSSLFPPLPFCANLNLIFILTKILAQKAFSVSALVTLCCLFPFSYTHLHSRAFVRLFFFFFFGLKSKDARLVWEDKHDQISLVLEQSDCVQSC